MRSQTCTPRSSSVIFLIFCSRVDPLGRSQRESFLDFSVNGVLMGPTVDPTMPGPKSMGHSAMGSWSPHLWHGSSINGWGHISMGGVMCYLCVDHHMGGVICSWVIVCGESKMGSAM